jgi:DNA-binding PadR family transcriptional regulator
LSGEREGGELARLTPKQREVLAKMRDGWTVRVEGLECKGTMTADDGTTRPFHNVSVLGIYLRKGYSALVQHIEPRTLRALASSGLIERDDDASDKFDREIRVYVLTDAGRRQAEKLSK